jgi:hypothetical protein
MKLTIGQVEARMTRAWGKKAFVISHRLAGNHYGYVVTDHSEHWLPLLTSWVGGGGRQLFKGKILHPISLACLETSWLNSPISLKL